MPTRDFYLNANNVHYSEALGGADTFDAYRVDLRAFWSHGSGHVLALRQYNWLTKDAPFAAQATVTLRGYKQGEVLAPYMFLPGSGIPPLPAQTLGRECVRRDRRALR